MYLQLFIKLHYNIISAIIYEIDNFQYLYSESFKTIFIKTDIQMFQDVIFQDKKLKNNTPISLHQILYKLKKRKRESHSKKTHFLEG